MSYKPDGHNDLSPYLVVPDPEAVLDFAGTVFGATRLHVTRRADGSIMHAECRIGDSVLMVGGAPGHSGATIHVYVPNAEAAFQRALDAGAEVICDMVDKGDGNMRGGVKTPCGTSWYIARKV